MSFYGSMTAAQKDVLSILASVAEMERGLIKERQAEGIAAAKAKAKAKGKGKGKHMGRPSTKVTKEQLEDLLSQGTTMKSIAEQLNLIRKVPAKTAADVGRAMVGMLWRYRRHVCTITADNGAEFCAHEMVADKLKTDIYFANPYSSWERGLNEISTAYYVNTSAKARIYAR